MGFLAAQMFVWVPPNRPVLAAAIVEAKQTAAVPQVPHRMARVYGSALVRWSIGVLHDVQSQAEAYPARETVGRPHPQVHPLRGRLQRTSRHLDCLRPVDPGQSLHQLRRDAENEPVRSITQHAQCPR